MTDEERARRVYHHMYETCEGIAEHAERIVALEELVGDMYESMWTVSETWAEDEYGDRVRELGVDG